MSEPFPRAMSAELIGKLRDLAERRRAHLQDLHESGRGRRYYSEGELVISAREATEQVDAWARLENPASEPGLPTSAPVIRKSAPLGEGPSS